VKLQGLDIRQDSLLAENRKIKKMLEEKEVALLEPRKKCEQLETELKRDEHDRKEMLDSLFQMINTKQSELQQKQDELAKN